MSTSNRPEHQADRAGRLAAAAAVVTLMAAMIDLAAALLG